MHNTWIYNHCINTISFPVLFISVMIVIPIVWVIKEYKNLNSK